MAKPFDASMPGGMDLGGGYTIRLIGIDPTSGNTITGITVASLTMLLEAVGDTTPPDLAVGPFQLVPGPGA